MELLLWVAVALALAAGSFFLFIASKPKPSPAPPGPKPLPIVGNLFGLRADFHRDLAELTAEFGPVISLQLGLTRWVVVSSPDAARDALQKHDQHVAARAVRDVANAHGHAARSVIWLPSTDPLWKQHRAVSTANLFTNRSIDSTRAVRERKVQQLVGALRRRYLGREVELSLHVYRAVLNATSNILFSEDVVDLSSDDPTHGFTDMLNDIVAAFATPNISDLFPLVRALDLQGCRRRNAGPTKKLYDFIDGVIERRRSEEKKHGDFLDMLLSVDYADGRAVNALIADFLAAGNDTIATTVEWAMAELLHNPSKMAKLRDEINRVAGGKEAVEEADIAELPYLLAVMKETLRLHPPGPLMLPHEVVGDGVEVGGFAIPRGTGVMVNIWAIMRDPAAWAEPEEFIPERFLAKETDFRGRDLEFIPFGSGRRACPGIPLATRMTQLVLASLVHAFEWRLPDGMTAADVSLEDKFSLSLKLAVPLRVVPVQLHKGGGEA